MPRRGPRPQVGAGGKLLEAPWTRTVVDCAELYGWRGYHTHDSRRSAAGFPDVTLVRVDPLLVELPELIFAELKTDDAGRRATLADLEGRPDWLADRAITNDQAAWLEDLRQVGAAFDDRLEQAVTDGSGQYDNLAEAVADRGIPRLEVYVWRPRDWPEVLERLSRGRHRLPPVNGPMAGRP